MMRVRHSCFPSVILAVAAWASWTALATSAQPQDSAQKPPTSPLGTYAGAKCPTPAPAGCVPGSAKDRVVVSSGKDGKTNASVRLVFDRGFSCNLKGEAQWIDDHFLVRSDGLDPAKPCQLELHVDKNFLQLRDADGLCQQVYCGAGAAFEGAWFEKLESKSNPKSATPTPATKSTPK